ncbi:MAG: hypothetical protein IBX67_06730 [Dehalococcoidia bacterium]|nr:hypothetical protein [Dehalococcoidia bacterium]
MIKSKLTLLCGAMLVLGLLMGGLPAFADDPAEEDHYVLTVVDCPDDLDETLPSWKTMPLVDGTLYEVRSYYLGRGKWCFAIENPEQRRLSAEEARQLLERAATPDAPPLLAVVDCPNDLNETVPSWAVMKVIDNTLYKWREYYLGDGKWCIVLERPEHRSLSAHEATLLWEKSIGIGREPTTPDPDDWVLVDLDDCPYLKNAQPATPVLPRDFDLAPPAEPSHSREPDTGAPPHRLSPPETDCYSEANTDQAESLGAGCPKEVRTSDFILSVEAPKEVKAGGILALKATLEYVGQDKIRLYHGFPVIRFVIFGADGKHVANDLFGHHRLYLDIGVTTPLELGQRMTIEDTWRIDFPGEYELIATTTLLANKCPWEELFEGKNYERFIRDDMTERVKELTRSRIATGPIEITVTNG